MEKYSNSRRRLRDKHGKFTRPPTLKGLGFDVNETGEKKTCRHCGHQQRPLLNTGWVCESCEMPN